MSTEAKVEVIGAANYWLFWPGCAALEFGDGNECIKKKLRMTDVFVSYSRKRRDAVVRLASVLKEYSVEVWFDVELRAGSIFASEIEERLTAAKCVLVMWTRDALRKGPKGWVYSEADWARSNNKLVQARLEKIELHPPFFNSVQPPVDLSSLGSSNKLTDESLQELLGRIGDPIKRPGLRSFVEARKSSDALVEWSNRFPNDPILVAQAAAVEAAKNDIRRRRDDEILRVRTQGCLETALKDLAHDIEKTSTASLSVRYAFPIQEADAMARNVIKLCDRSSQEGLLKSDALRAVVCGSVEEGNQGPCLALIAAGRLFVVALGFGTVGTQTQRGIPISRLQAVLLTTAAKYDQAADFIEMLGETACDESNSLLPVYGPDDTQCMVDGLNQAAGFDGSDHGLQAWGPSPEPSRSVIVFEGDGLVVSAFTTEHDATAGRIGYRFWYHGRSIVVGSGSLIGAGAVANADVVMQGAQSETLLERGDFDMLTSAEVSAHAKVANAGLVVLTPTENQAALNRRVAEARQAGYYDVIAGRSGMLVELPLDNSDINVRPL